MIAFAGQADIPQLKTLWKRSFEDEQTYIDSYYTNRGSAARTLLYRAQNGEIAAMLDMFDIDLKIGQELFPAFYLYAAATLPEYRKQGIMHRLIAFACDDAIKNGQVASVLIPQTPALVAFYRQQGYTIPIFIGKTQYEEFDGQMGSSVSIAQLSLAEFIRMKTAFEQKQTNCVVHSPQMQALIYHQTIISDGKVLKIQNCSGQSYALCYKIKDMVLVQEISCDVGVFHQAAAALCDYFNARKLQIRHVPVGSSELYGLCCPLNEKLPELEKNFYMNTMLD